MVIHPVLKGSFEHNLVVEERAVTAPRHGGGFVALLLQLLQFLCLAVISQAEMRNAKHLNSDLCSTLCNLFELGRCSL